ncbi:MAG: hypothetical protein LQ347_005080 [Umbilicaria vellea]|nr:MAG: hypothetical protein LQ347_005080 [Umbilicaria vellea]
MGSGAEVEGEGEKVWTRYRTVESGSERVVGVVEAVVSGVPRNDGSVLDVGIAAPGVLVDDACNNATSAAVDEEAWVDVVDVTTIKSATLRTLAALEAVGDDVVGTVKM